MVIIDLLDRNYILHGLLSKVAFLISFLHSSSVLERRLAASRTGGSFYAFSFFLPPWLYGPWKDLGFFTHVRFISIHFLPSFLPFSVGLQSLKESCSLTHGSVLCIFFLPSFFRGSTVFEITTAASHTGDPLMYFVPSSVALQPLKEPYPPHTREVSSIHLDTWYTEQHNPERRGQPFMPSNVSYIY